MHSQCLPTSGTIARMGSLITRWWAVAWAITPQPTQRSMPAVPRQAGNDRGGAPSSSRVLHKTYHLPVGAQASSAGTDLAHGPGHRGATQTWVGPGHGLRASPCTPRVAHLCFLEPQLPCATVACRRGLCATERGTAESRGCAAIRADAALLRPLRMIGDRPVSLSG
jgi:hypothetical protein